MALRGVKTGLGKCLLGQGIWFKGNRTTRACLYNSGSDYIKLSQISPKGKRVLGKPSVSESRQIAME